MKRFFGHAIWPDGICLLRIWCGIIFVRYGLSVLHIDSMKDFSSTLNAVNIPYPVISAYLCKATEFFGAIFLITGFLVRPACLLIIIDMAVATFIFHHGQLLNNGLTTFLLLICLLTIFFIHTDKFSIDYYFTRSKNTHE